TFESAGVPIHYRDRGTGQPVVLVHGFAMSLERWEAAGVPQKLEAAGYRAITIDCRGHGESGTPHDPKAYGAEMSKDVVRLLDHLGIGKAHLVGYSMGGFVANKARELHPERFHSLVLGGSGWYRAGDYAIAELTAREIAEGLEKTGDFRFMLRAFEAKRDPPVTDEEIETRNRRMMEGSDPRALAAVLRGWDGFAVPEANLRSNTVPSVAIVGGDDPIKPKTDRLAEVMANVSVVVIDEADHGALADPRFAKEVIAFLKRQAAPSSREP
ncbi:MAG: alpha/beta fold hydrolase, partial [Vicinamibacteria bacterium]